MDKNSKKNPENQNFHLDLKPNELENSDFEFGFRIENDTRSKFGIFHKKFRFQISKNSNFKILISNSDSESNFTLSQILVKISISKIPGIAPDHVPPEKKLPEYVDKGGNPLDLNS